MPLDPMFYFSVTIFMPFGSFTRLACICSSSGSIHVLRITTNIFRGEGHQEETIDNFPLVQKFASIELPGDVFSSPVMISGRIYVGCRDDKLHCIEVAN